jgi:hypothetical protein
MLYKIALFDEQCNKLQELCICRSEERAEAKVTAINKALGHKMCEDGTCYQKEGVPVAMIDL